MYGWVDAVYDRTQADVDYAIAKINELKKSNLTDVPELKGCVNASDLNRIENNTRRLVDYLYYSLYIIPIKEHEKWEDTHIPTTEDIADIINNVKNIIKRYSKQYDFAPNVIWDDVNEVNE